MDHFSRLLKFHRHRLIINYFDDNYRSGKQFSSIHPGIAKTFLKTHGGVQKALNRLSDSTIDDEYADFITSLFLER